MALTGMQIYKSLPKTNCKDCGFPTCMAFAMQVAAKQKALTDCKHLSASALAELADASAPPMKLITIGPEGNQVVFGQETVMFRHEEKFHHRSAIAVSIPSTLSDADATAKAEKINASVFQRVGETLKVQLAAVELDGCADPAARAKLIADVSAVPLILMSSSPDSLNAAAGAVREKRPLLYRADLATVDRMAQIAKDTNLALAVCADSLERLADAIKAARDTGVNDLVLSFDSDNVGDVIRQATMARRAALRKNFRGLGFPAMMRVRAASPEAETLQAVAYAVKYGAIVIIDTVEPWALLPIFTAIQNVYTDPQMPNAVEAKLYEVGAPTENSPVLFTTNFSLTFFSVQGEVERSKIPAYISVVETEGLGVLNAYAGDKISAEKVVKTLRDQKVAQKVKHRTLIIPGLLPIFKAEIEETSEWKEVIIGPETASKIPAFLNERFK